MPGHALQKDAPAPQQNTPGAVTRAPVTSGELAAFGLLALRQEGYEVERILGGGAGQRQISRNDETWRLAIVTSRDTWIGFEPKPSGGFAGLDEADLVLVVSIDSPHYPRNAKAHLIPAQAVREGVEDAVRARAEAGFAPAPRRRVLISLYEPETPDQPILVGAGLGLVYPPFATCPLAELPDAEPAPVRVTGDLAARRGRGLSPEDLAAVETARRDLAETLGLPQSAIHIRIGG